jgi:two-component system cell cycle sensor histidine kinase/response regulator CckA
MIRGVGGETTVDTTVSATGVKTVLVADDDAQLLGLLVRLLERGGHSVLSAPDGAEAIEVFRAHALEIDLAVLDVGLEPNGVGEPLKRMLEARPDLPVVLASGDLPPEAISAQLDEIGGVFLRKPFPPPALLCALEEAQEASAKIG